MLVSNHTIRIKEQRQRTVTISKETRQSLPPNEPQIVIAAPKRVIRPVKASIGTSLKPFSPNLRDMAKLDEVDPEPEAVPLPLLDAIPLPLPDGEVPVDEAPEEVELPLPLLEFVDPEALEGGVPRGLTSKEPEEANIWL